MSINAKLTELYTSKWDGLVKELSKINDNPDMTIKPTNPLLLKVGNEKEYLLSEFKLMIFGQETNGWYEENDEIVDIQKCYDDFFNSGGCYNYGGQFWNGVHLLINKLTEKNNNKKIDVLWNNVVKIGKSEGKGFSEEDIYNIERQKFDVISEEINILKPNFIVFFSGPNYDSILQDNFGDIKLSSIKNFSQRQLAKLQVKGIPAIRTYHPNYLWRNDINKYFDAIIREIHI